MSSNGHTTPRFRIESEKVEPLAPQGVSGRVVVICACVVVLCIWGGLTLGMRAWKADYESKAEFGRTQIAPLVDPLAEMVPVGVEPAAWAAAVQDTHKMLHALTAASLLDMKMLEDLKSKLETQVNSAKPETVQAMLTELWDDQIKKAGPVMNASAPPPPNTRHAKRVERPERPAILTRK